MPLDGFDNLLAEFIKQVFLPGKVQAGDSLNLDWLFFKLSTDSSMDSLSIFLTPTNNQRLHNTTE